MKQTSNIERRTSNIELPNNAPAFGVRRFLWRILDFLVAAVFIYAGVIKVLDPVQFAHDVDNYKILPWTLGVALAFYLPWLEILCGPRSGRSPALPWRVVGFDCAHDDFSCCHNRRKGSWSRY